MERGKKEERKRKRSTSEEKDSWNDWSSWDRWKNSSSESEGEDKKLKSEVKKIGKEQKGEDKDEEIVKKFKNKVIIIKRGPKWDKDWSIEEWIKEETGLDCGVEFMKNSRDIAKIWFDDPETRKKIWSRKVEWERKGVARLEEWKSAKERTARYEALDEMREVARKAGFSSTRIEIKERKEKETERRRTEGEGQNWRLREWRGERAREKRRAMGPKRA